MLTIGLTGQSGAGKGTFSHIFSQYEGVLHIDTDVDARAVTARGEECLEKLCECFGNEILEEDGSLNRKKLARIAFSDEEKHKQLNRITHFYVMKRIEAHLEKAKSGGMRVAIVDAPLLFESGADRLCDINIAVIAPYNVRLERIVKRDGISRSDAIVRLDSQPSDAFYRERCDYILENGEDIESFTQKAKELIGIILENNSFKD